MLTKWENEGEGGGQHRPEASPGRGAKCTATQAPELSVHALTTSAAALGGGECSPKDQAPVSVPLHPVYGHLGLPAGHHPPASPVIGPAPGSPSNRPRSYYTPEDGLGT